ncbi:hypothetical protein HK101_009788 [Irineochytrium annulatum]|nr:hypothetical protein HK101_009788 [Irineochytrium annulatum]
MPEPIRPQGRAAFICVIAALCLLPSLALAQLQISPNDILSPNIIRARSPAPQGAPPAGGNPPTSPVVVSPSRTAAAPAATGTGFTIAPNATAFCNPATNPNGCPDSTGASSCSEAYVPGWISFSSPNITSILPVGNTLLVNWTYGGAWDPTYPRTSVAVYYAQVASSSSALGTYTVNPRTWYQNPLVTNLDPKSTVFNWNVGSLASGIYQLRIVADGVDPALMQLNGQSACLNDGQPLPGISAAFRVVGNGQLQSFADYYGPSTSGAAKDGGLRSLGRIWGSLLVMGAVPAFLY